MLIAMFLFCGSISAQKDWQHISASNAAFSYSGRFDFSNPEAVRYDWSGSAIRFQFTGKNLQLLLQGGDRNYFNVFVDGQLHEVLHAPADSVYTLKDLKGKGPHQLILQKRTEGGMGTAFFKGINIEEKASVMPYPVEETRKIEFFGNSITCGYGTEGASRTERFAPNTENVNKSYAFISARAMNAECRVVAHSGLGIVRNYGDKEKISRKIPALPARFDQVLDEDSTAHWDFSKWKPDAVVINLGTNDYSTQPQPDKVVFQRRYEQFIREIRGVYGNVPIFCVSGPMVNEPAYSIVKEMVETTRTLYNDANLYFVGIPLYLLNQTSDLGSDWHPSYKGQCKMAGHLVPVIGSVLDWNYSLKEIEEVSNQQ